MRRNEGSLIRKKRNSMDSDKRLHKAYKNDIKASMGGVNLYTMVKESVWLGLVSDTQGRPRECSSDESERQVELGLSLVPRVWSSLLTSSLLLGRWAPAHKSRSRGGFFDLIPPKLELVLSRRRVS